jgi:hypothetical protein
MSPLNISATQSKAKRVQNVLNINFFHFIINEYLNTKMVTSFRGFGDGGMEHKSANTSVEATTFEGKIKL